MHEIVKIIFFIYLTAIFFKCTSLWLEETNTALNTCLTPDCCLHIPFLPTSKLKKDNKCRLAHIFFE